jgi:ribosomal protein S18 acetylase RimI-like enzyme
MPELRSMCLGDLARVIQIIEAHDEDDGEAAQAQFEDEGFDTHFVIERDEKVVGVTGYQSVASTDGTYWLSWTYLDEACRGQGLGKSMVLQLIEKLGEKNGRKLFVKVSDYEDPEDGKIYENAFKLYESLGFKEEIVSLDFYDEGENQHILGLMIARVEDSDFEDKGEVADEKPIIRFDGLHEIAETEGSYTFRWDVMKKKALFGKRNFSVQDLEIGLDSVVSSGGRKVFLTFPSNLPLIHTPLQTVGFKYVGCLSDYYEKGVHEFHFTHDLVKG